MSTSCNYGTGCLHTEMGENQSGEKKLHTAKRKHNSVAGKIVKLKDSIYKA